MSYAREISVLGNSVVWYMGQPGYMRQLLVFNSQWPCKLVASAG